MFPFHASMHVPKNYAVHLAGAIKAAIDIPVFAAGRIMSAAQAEQILADEQADGVEMIRALIADPDLPRLSQEGHARRLRPCISCNQGCQVRGVMNATISCSVNPDVKHAQPLPPEKPQVKSGQKVYIIGGGPAGLEAARTAALRGREVVLYERDAILGGTVVLAAKGPGRGELQLITDYLVSELERFEIEVHTGVEVTAKMILAQRPHTVVIATGASTGWGLLPIQGHDLPHVIDIRRVLAGEPVEGQRVVVIDETDSHGVLSAIDLLVSAGKNVEVVTEDFYVGRDLVATHDLVLWKQRVLPHGIVQTPHTNIMRIEPGKVIVIDRFAEGERELPAESVVLGTYERPAQELYKELKDHVPHLLRIGDCVAPRRIEQAILEGRRAGEQV
jgi:thioredoxin reductase